MAANERKRAYDPAPGSMIYLQALIFIVAVLFVGLAMLDLVTR
ncbi:hypothetical protein BH10PSE7_BH10PSE7_33200 [soil metagenome]